MRERCLAAGDRGSEVGLLIGPRELTWTFRRGSPHELTGLSKVQVLFWELKSVAEFPPTHRLTQNAESESPRRFAFSRCLARTYGEWLLVAALSARGRKAPSDGPLARHPAQTLALSV